MKPTDEEYLIAQDLSIREVGRKGFQQEITDGFRMGGFRFVYHTHDSRFSPKGYPDTVVLVEPRLYAPIGRPPQIVIEAKVGRNKPSPEQIEWLEMYRVTGAMTFVLWPRHRPVLAKLYAAEFDDPLVQERLHTYVK